MSDSSTPAFLHRCRHHKLRKRAHQDKSDPSPMVPAMTSVPPSFCPTCRCCHDKLWRRARQGDPDSSPMDDRLGGGRLLYSRVPHRPRVPHGRPWRKYRHPRIWGVLWADGLTLSVATSESVPHCFLTRLYLRVLSNTSHSRRRWNPGF
jgi:hypothetical protein